jgi:hypothetical protein
MKPWLKAPGTKRLKLEYDVQLSNFAFKFDWRRYNTEGVPLTMEDEAECEETSKANVVTKVRRCSLTPASTPG